MYDSTNFITYPAQPNLENLNKQLILGGDHGKHGSVIDRLEKH